MNIGNFYEPEAVKPLYGEIVPAYQTAFAGEPWYEVSKCADEAQRCVAGLSAVAVGALCETCGNRPTRPAYEADELVARFDALGASRPTAWYIEQNELGVTLAAVAWEATAGVVASEKYKDNPAMAEWLNEKLGNGRLMWLDEVFANRELKPRGNLQNFGAFITGLAEMLDTREVAYRTIQPRMLTAPKRDFGDAATVFNRQTDVPDRREFVVIKLGEEE